MTMYLNESKNVLSTGEQLQPVLENGHLIYGRLMPDGTFLRDPPDVDIKGPDILHEPIPGQECLADDDPRVIAFMNRGVKTIDQLVEFEMNSIAVLALRAAMNNDAAADERMRNAIRIKLKATIQPESIKVKIKADIKPVHGK